LEKTTDVSDQHPQARILPAVFKDFGGRLQFSGPALTVKCFEDNSRIQKSSQTPGDGRVLVVDGGGSKRFALCGDLIAMDLQRNGWAGLVIYGCVRDTGVLASVLMGIKAIAAHPRKTVRLNEGQVGVRLDIGGICVDTGDKVVADEDGILLLPAAG
jgi:regulator of ribonuclease activity A